MIQDPKNPEYAIGKTYSFDKILSLGYTDFCYSRYNYETKIKVSPELVPCSWITGILVQSSDTAVLTLFCALIWTTSLLAEELDNRTKEEGFLLEGDAVSSALDDWLCLLDKIYLLVESVNDLFNGILAIAAFYYFSHFPLSTFTFLDYFFMKTKGKTTKTWGKIFINMLPMLMDVLRLGTIAFVCQQLQIKVLY